MKKIAVLLNTWQLDARLDENTQKLSSFPGVVSFEKYIIGMSIQGVSNWPNEKTFWNKLLALAKDSDYILIVKAQNAPIEPVILKNMLKHIIVSRYDYLYFDGLELGLGNNLRFELIRSDTVSKLVSKGANLFEDQSIDAFGKCDAACYFPLQEDCVAYYTNYYDELYSYPTLIGIDGVSACNLKCKMCRYHGQNHSSYTAPAVPFMDDSLYYRIIDEAAQYPRKPTIEMCLRGEELLAKNFLQRVKYIKKHGLPLILVTNAQLLDRETAGAILDEGIDHIVVSTEGFTKKTYESIMQGGSYERFMGNVKALLEEKEKRSAPTWITLKMVLQDENINEVDDFIGYWKQMPITAMVFQNCLYVDGDGNHISHNTARPLPWRTLCRNFFLNVMITTAGLCTVCCVHDSEHDENMIGDFNKESLLDIWRGERMKTFQKAALEGRFEDIPMCDKCDGNTCKSVVMARWDQGDMLKSIYHSVSYYQIK